MSLKMGGGCLREETVNRANNSHLLGGAVVFAVGVFVPVYSPCPLNEVVFCLVLIVPGTLWASRSFPMPMMGDFESAVKNANCFDPTFVVDQRRFVVTVGNAVDLLKDTPYFFGGSGLVARTGFAAFSCEMI